MGVFAMPSLGADMEAGTLVEWLVAPGDHVRRGDVVAVVETQKGAIEIEIFEEGDVARLIAGIGETVPVGAPLAEIAGVGIKEAEIRGAGAAGAGAGAAPDRPAAAGRAPEPAVPCAAPAEPSARPSAAPSASPQTAAPAPPVAAAGATPPASPAARMRAAELGLDLAALAGSGPGGAVLLADVERASRRPSPAPGPIARPSPGPGAARPPSMRDAIAAAMARSKREIPHYYLGHEIDLAAAAGWLAAKNATLPPEERLVMGALFVKAVALAVAKAPEVNGSFEEGAFRPSAAVHVGLAISLRGGGLVAPALMDVGTRSLTDVMAAMRDLVERTRAGRLRSSEMSSPTITVSSLGDRGVDRLQAIIFPPQVGLVGFGTPRERPLAVGGEVVARLAVSASFSGDHRVSDGRAGARFLARIDSLLQRPEAL